MCVCVCDDWKHFRHSRVPSGARWSGITGLLGLLSSVTHIDALLLSLNPQVLLWWVLSGKTGPLQTVSPSPGRKWSSRLPTSWTMKSNTTRGYAPYVSSRWAVTVPLNQIISAISSTQEASLPENIRRSRAMCIVSEQNPKCADPSIMHLLSRLCSPSALILNKMENYVFCFKHGCDNGFMQTYVWQKIFLFITAGNLHCRSKNSWATHQRGPKPPVW